MSDVRLLFVVGPTACGKSDFAVELCEILAARGLESEIINCDSVQFFEGVQIGAAKPGPELLARARHHLIGHVPLGGSYNAGDFCRDAEKVIAARRAQGVRHFVAVGGSGFYVQALEKGMYDVPKIPAEIRQELERVMAESGPEPLYQELRERDPQTAARIEPADRYRILRSLEILRAHPAGGTLSEIRARFEANKKPSSHLVSKVGLFRPRDILRKRVEERTEMMLQTGLLDEVRDLRAMGLGSWSPMQSVGYKEAQACLDGTLGREELAPAIVTSTMQLAKRQMTWFKRDPSIAWFDRELGFERPLAHASENFLGGLPA
jgi:tRNA dimethylallyltransferase